ncbi:MAG: hypothetical protein LC677_05750 [Halomonas sp.]|nr:hypothetical protein [Halomonas sp.]
MLENQGTHYRTTFEAGGPALGGTKEAMHSERVKVEGDQTMAQSHTEHANNLIRGTRG